MALAEPLDVVLAEKVYAAVLIGRFPNTDFTVGIDFNMRLHCWEVSTTMRKNGRPTHSTPVHHHVPDVDLYTDYSHLPIIPAEEVFATLMLLGAE